MSDSIDTRFAGMTPSSIADKADKAISSFYKMKNSEQDAKRTVLTQKFLANGFDGMSADDIFQFFEEFKRGKLGVPVTTENMEKMAQMLGKMPKANDYADFSHGKSKVGLQATQKINMKAIRHQTKKIKKLIKKATKKEESISLEYNHDFSPTGSIIKDWQLGRKKKRIDKNMERLHKRVDKAEKRIATLESKIAGSSKWNPRRWPQRLALNIASFRYERLSKKLIDKSSIDSNFGYADKTAKLQQELASGVSADRAHNLNRKIRMYQRLDEYYSSQNNSKHENYDAAMNKLQENYNASANPRFEKIAQHYESMTEREDMLDYSTTTGKWMYAILEKDPSNKKNLESIYLQRKREDFANRDEFYKHLLEQVGAKNSDVVEFLAAALERQNPLLQRRLDGQTEDQPQDPVEPNANEEQPEGNVNEQEAENEANPDRPTTEINMQNIYTSYHEAGYGDIYPGFPPSMTEDEQLDYVRHNSSFKKNNGDTLKISRPDADTYIMSARDKENKDTSPELEDMKVLLSALKQDGHTSLKLGHIKSPEFLARMVVASEQCGLEISNLVEKQKELADKGLYQQVEAEIKRLKGNEEVIIEESERQQPETQTENMDAQEMLKHTPDIADLKEDSLENIQQMIKGLDALTTIQDTEMTPEKYNEFKQGEAYKNLTPKQQKILDATQGLQQASKEGKIDVASKKYLATMTKLANDYKSTLAKDHKDKGKTKGIDRAKETFARRTISQIAKATTER